MNITVQDLVGDSYLMPGWIFMSIDRALATYRFYTDDPIFDWSAFWLPIFESGGGDFLYAELGKPSKNGINIRFYATGYMDEGADELLGFPDIRSMISAYLIGFRTDKILLRSDGAFGIDRFEISKMAREI